jgi:hypothetical protein
LLPAVQAAREAARRTQCQNNLKNDALAVIGYVDANKQYPIGVAGGNPTKASIASLPKGVEEGDLPFCERGVSWVTQILPYLEEQSLYNTVFDPSGLPLNPGDPFPFPNMLQAGPALLGLEVWRGGGTTLATFRCPSSELPALAEGCIDKYVNGYATSDYKGNNGFMDQGIFTHFCDNARAVARKFGTGVQLIVLARIGPEDVTDGLSKTLLIGESSYYVRTRRQGGGEGNDHWPVWIGGITSDEQTLFKTDENAPIGCGVSPKSVDNFFTGTQAGVSILSQNPGPVDNDCAFSWHHEGAFFAFCDGSVHFLSETIEMEIYKNVGQRNDDNIIRDFE